MIWGQYWGLWKMVPLLLHSPLIWSPINPGFLNKSYIYLPCSRFLRRSAVTALLWCRLIWMNLYFEDSCPSLDYGVINFNALCLPSIITGSGSGRDPLSAAYRAQLSLVPSSAGPPPGHFFRISDEVLWSAPFASATVPINWNLPHSHLTSVWVCLRFTEYIKLPSFNPL